MSLPAAIKPFLEFTGVLRAHGFAVSPDQSIGWLEAIGLLGPREMGDIRRSAVAMLAIPKEREPEFDTLFDGFFFGQTISAPVTADDDEVDAFEPTGTETEIEEDSDEREIGTDATAAERLARRALGGGEEDALRRFSRLAPRRLPRRRSYRRVRAKRGDTMDVRRALREAVRKDGEVMLLPQRRRKLRQRPVLLLIDVSGSMKERTNDLVRFGHALANNSLRFEAFTLGTRLTRITPALSVREQSSALNRVAGLVADLDGGTRIGEALQTLLAVPRYAGFARGAAIIVLSDGLERGEPNAMIDAVRRLSRMAWRIIWLSPLAGREDYRPETEALGAVLSDLDGLDDGGSLDAICTRVLNMARAA